MTGFSRAGFWAMATPASRVMAIRAITKFFMVPLQESNDVNGFGDFVEYFFPIGS
jgi:hypothetical protein